MSNDGEGFRSRSVRGAKYVRRRTRGHIRHRDERRTVRRAAFSPMLVQEATTCFEGRLGRAVSHDEARNLLGHLADYIWMLVRWDEVSSEAKSLPEERGLHAPAKLSKR